MEDIFLKSYHGYAASGEAITARILVRTRGGKTLLLNHHRVFSENGMTWGDASDGTLDLARSILLDALGQTECPGYPELCECDIERVEEAYDPFHSDMISPFQSDRDWKLTQNEVLDWVFDYLDSKNQPTEAMA